MEIFISTEEKQTSYFQRGKKHSGDINIYINSMCTISCCCLNRGANCNRTDFPLTICGASQLQIRYTLAGISLPITQKTLYVYGLECCNYLKFQATRYSFLLWLILVCPDQFSYRVSYLHSNKSRKISEQHNPPFLSAKILLTVLFKKNNKTLEESIISSI